MDDHFGHPHNETMSRGPPSERFDATPVVQITDALLMKVFSEQDMTATMGGNTIRVLRDGTAAVVVRHTQSGGIRG